MPGLPIAADVVTIAIIAIGLVLSTGLSIVLLNWVKNNAGQPSKKSRALMASGIEAPGVIQKVTDTGARINRNPRIRLELEVQPPGETAFTVSHTETFSLVQIPQAGQSVTVFYDPNDRSQMAIKLKAPSVKPSTESDSIEKLNQLADMHDRGLITDAEFEQKKQKLLGEL